MDPIWNFIGAANGWAMWLFLSLALLVLYFSLRHLVWRGEKPNERKILKRFLVVFLLSIFITSLTVYGMKLAFEVPRPCVSCDVNPTDCDTYCPDDFSFPSGHSATIFVLFTSFFLIYRKKQFLPFFIFPAMVAYSRIFLGVHTYTDIIGGSIVGILIPIAVWKIERILHVLKA